MTILNHYLFSLIHAFEIRRNIKHQKKFTNFSQKKSLQDLISINDNLKLIEEFEHLAHALGEAVVGSTRVAVEQHEFADFKVERKPRIEQDYSVGRKNRHWGVLDACTRRGGRWW